MNEVLYINNVFDSCIYETCFRYYYQKLRKKAKQRNSLLICHCCFSDCCREEVIACQDSQLTSQPHWFCQVCIQNQVQECIFGIGKCTPELPCMEIQECVSTLSQKNIY